jgi:ferredoxin
MPEYTVEENALSGFFKQLADGRVLLAPVGQGDQCQLAECEPDKVGLAYSNTHLSPKTAFFPQTERILAFTKDPASPASNVYQDLGDKARPTVVFGIRPCDARGLAVANRVFQNDRFTDPYWKGKYEAAIRIGLACPKPFPQCFCAHVGGSPYGEEGLDALAFPLDNGIGIKPVSERGAELLKGLGLKEADLSSELKAQAEAATKAQGPPPDLTPLAKKGLMDLFSAPHWLGTAEACLNCGVCTFFCPTCHCFDIQDENSDKGGVRMRNWDTCMSWLFTIHGTGHNPRPSKTERVRQRFMHKLKYIPLKQEGHMGCIGCGRCVAVCPANIDIRSVALSMCQDAAASQA